MAQGVRLSRPAMRELLTAPFVAAELTRRADAIKAAAESSAPRDSGALAASHRVEVDVSGDRARVRVTANTPYAARVAADSGYLGTALSAGRR